ncbi:MAG: AAA family ATPase [Planctomycetota bacterium]|nr:AAA family ATPase [Planctomycetota bacterium]
MTTSASKLTECPQVIRGMVQRVFYNSPSFSAGVIRTDDGDFVKFRGKFHATEGDVVAVVGRWTKDRKYGRQFDVDGLSYDLPESTDGLAAYLASHPAFEGIGPATAEKLVEYAGTGKALDDLVRNRLGELHERLRIPMSTLSTLQEAWIANTAENEVRSYLAQFGLTHHQMNVLLETFGNAVVGVLRNDPYRIIKAVKGYGFKRVDKIARRMGTPKDHPGRLAAGIVYCLNEALDSGHTWTGGSDLLQQANELLLLDGMDSLEAIRRAAEALLEQGEIACDGKAIALPAILDAEKYIQDRLLLGADDLRIVPPIVDVSDLTAAQAEAFEMATENVVSVISGGAGTGKTFVIARLAEAFKSLGLRIALCAPTGKAAKRIEEVMREHGLDLEAKTIHRLLEYNGQVFNRESLSSLVIEYDEFGEEITRSPAYDAVIVDEVSMVDVPLMRVLLSAIDFDKTRLVLVGDHNQLPPVGPGNVLRDIIHGNLAPKTVLTEVVRQAGVLKANSGAVLHGTVAPTAVNDPGWVVVDCFKEAAEIQVHLRDLVVQLIPDRLGYDPVRQVQIITPMHNGPLGTKALNEMMQFLFHGKVEGRFAIGDKVIQTSNDYEMGVMNGTVGYVVDFADGEYFVEFEGGQVHKIDGERQQRIQLAYALTAHKAQGSEFPCAVVICHKSHFFADRNWLYTAVTRASKTCILVGDRWGLRHAAGKNNTIKRRTFLSLWASQGGQITP